LGIAIDLTQIKSVPGPIEWTVKPSKTLYLTMGMAGAASWQGKAKISWKAQKETCEECGNPVNWPKEFGYHCMKCGAGREVYRKWGDGTKLYTLDGKAPWQT
jgi:hypothetical protein